MPLLPHPEKGGVIALVGAGGKTCAMFGLAEELSMMGPDVLMTTTTHIFDPRLEQGRLFDQVVLDSTWAEPTRAGTNRIAPWDLASPFPDRGRRIVLVSGEEVIINASQHKGPQQNTLNCTGNFGAFPKLRGIHPTRITELRKGWDFVVVEADGAHLRPIKAPKSHEPVIPSATNLVLGIVGLDCLGQPMDTATVHRPECFAPITGCAPGAPIQLEHIAALARSPQGLFKGVPAGARRVLLLNKADLCSLEPFDLLRGLQAFEAPCADLILVCALHDPDPAKRVLAQTPPKETAEFFCNSPRPGETSKCP